MLLLRTDLCVEVHGDHCTEVFHFFRHHPTSFPHIASKQYLNKGKIAIDKNNQQFFNLEAN